MQARRGKYCEVLQRSAPFKKEFFVMVQRGNISRIIYFSTNNIGGGDEVAATLKQILSSSIRNNVAAGITGGLMFNRNYFVQVLEGEHSSLLNTFTRIRADTRHQEIVLVEQKPVNDRFFGAWSMGFAGKTELFNQVLERFSPSGKFVPRDMAGEQLLAFVLEMVSKENGFVSSTRLGLVEI